MNPAPSAFWVEVKELLQRIIIKFLVMVQSRKFWAFFFGALAILNRWHAGALDPETAVWSLVSLIVAYSGLVAAEDIFATRE